MMIVIFNTATDELLQTCTNCREDILPEEIAYKVLDARNLNRIDYTIRGIVSASYTTNEFKKYMYIDNGVIKSKEHQQLFIDKYMITADNIDKAILTNCTIGAEVYINNILLGVVEEDGIVEVSSSIPNELNIKIIKDYWLTQEVIINAT